MRRIFLLAIALTLVIALAASPALAFDTSEANPGPAISAIEARVSTQAETDFGGQITYTVTLTGVNNTGTIALSFVVDTANQSIDTARAVTPLSGFTTLSIEWSAPADGLRMGTIVLMYPGFTSSSSPLDILKVTTTALDKAGEASMTISSLEITGNVDGMSGYQASAIIVDKATTRIGDQKPVYSKYDLNQDGKINDLDSNIAVYFYMKTSSSAGWDTVVFDRATAKEADVNKSGRVDMADLIEILANYSAN